MDGGARVRLVVLIAMAAMLCRPCRLLAQTGLVLHGNRPAEAAMLAPAGVPDPGKVLSLEITLRLHHRAELDRLIEEQQDPRSPHYRHWLTPGEFNAHFGANQAEADMLADWLRSQSFQVTAVDPAGSKVRFTGTVAQAEQAFATHIGAFGAHGAYSNLTEPIVPTGFTDLIGAIHGLDNFHRAVPMTHLAASPSVITARHPELPSLELGGFGHSMTTQPDPNAGGFEPEQTVAGYGTAFGPADLHVFYDENPLLDAGVNGNGECVAIIGDSDFLASAVNLFNTTMGLPPSSITQVNADGVDPGTNSSEIEALLDLEWSHAAAPGAATWFYTGSPSASTPLADAILRAVSDNTCGVISISFAFCGRPPAFFTQTLDPLFAQGAAQGQSIFVAAGDQGAAGIVFNPSTSACVVATTRNVNEMSADPNVTSVGGTSFFPTYGPSGVITGYVPESVWNDEAFGGGATGGGASAVFVKPSWQNGLGVPADLRRDVPDVALVASPNFPGLWLGSDIGGPVITCCIGGTSAGAPIWAGIAALLDQQAGGRVSTINSGLYQLVGQSGQAAAGLHDITTGDNGYNGVAGFPAGPGYDQSTGWGTVDAAVFIPAFLGAPVVSSLPPVIYTGASFNIEGAGFTPGSVVNFFVSTSGGPVNQGPLTPSTHSPTQLGVQVPASVTQGEGVAGVQVVNTDRNYASSATILTLLQGAAGAGLPSITGINGIAISPTSTERGFSTANVETVVALGTPMTLNGSGFDAANGVAVDLFCSCPGGKVGPFFVTPSNAGNVGLTLPSTGSQAPAAGPGSFRVTNAGASKAYAHSSNSVSAPIGAAITVTNVSQSGSLITVSGTGFSALTAINFFNTQGGGVANLGGLNPNGSPKIPLTIFNSGTFTFTVPAGAIAGASYVQALNPPFIPFTSSGSAPGGAFVLNPA